MKQNPPTELGYYWAKTHGRQWYDVIAEVHGTFPFLKIRGWSRIDQRLCVYQGTEIAEWGPKIETPE